MSAGIIRPEEWPLRRWFYANPLWYYHAPGVNSRARQDDRFYRLVDPHLRAICRMVHRAGLRTTASCQGHFHSREHFAEVWDQLQRDRDQIIGTGLIVHDAETDAPHLFRNAQFELPWHDLGGFQEQAARNQSQGFLGIVVPRERISMARLLSLERYRTAASCIVPDRKLSQALNGLAFTVSVKAGSEDQQAIEWGGVYGYLETAIGDEARRNGEFTHFDRTLLIKR